jgi:hypothetical protein
LGLTPFLVTQCALEEKDGDRTAGEDRAKLERLFLSLA